MNSDDEWNLDIEADDESDNEVFSVEHEDEQDHQEDHQEHEEGDQEHEDEEQEVSESDDDDIDDIDGDPNYVEIGPVTREHFDFVKRLGTGAYGTVFLVKKNCGIDKGRIYAIKVIAKDVVVETRKTIIHMKAERKVLELLRGCPYIPNLYYAFQTADKLFIVVDYIPGGEMFTLLQKNVLDEQRVRFYVAELIIALEHIHKHDIVYRDIKLENILIDADGHVKLVDFGLCKKLGIKRRTKSFCGTVEYMAPEVVKGTGHNTAADWWALGVLTIELLTGVTAFGTNDPTQQNEIMERILHNEPTMPQNISHEMEDFILKMLNKDPVTRLGDNGEVAIDIRNHPLFNGMDWNKLEKKELQAPDVPTITDPFDVQNFSDEFTSQIADYDPSGIPKNSFSIFKGYSYIAPELERIESHDLENIDESLKALSLDVFNKRQPGSKFFQKYNFTSDNPIGYGATSVCMKCQSLTNNNNYAVKIYNRRTNCAVQIEVLEKCAAKKVKGIVQLIEVITDAKWIYLVMEFIDGVNLLQHLNTISFNGKYVCDIFVALCKILKKLHSLKYSHGRVCLKNIRCIKNTADIRLIGFGYAQPMAEIIDEHIDFWSIGVCLYTLLCGHSPFQMLSSNISKMATSIQDNNFNKESLTWVQLHDETRRLIEQLFLNTISNLKLRMMKSIANETFLSPLTNAKQLINENQKIISIRTIKRGTTSDVTDQDENGGSPDLIENSLLNGDVILENGNNSIESPDISIAPSMLQSQEIHSTQKNSQNGKNESCSPSKNISIRRRCSTPLTDEIDLSTKSPSTKSTRINNINAPKRRSKLPTLADAEYDESIDLPSPNASKRSSKSPTFTDNDNDESIELSSPNASKRRSKSPILADAEYDEPIDPPSPIASKRRSKSPTFTNNENDESIELSSSNASERRTNSPKLTEELSAQETLAQQVQNGDSCGEIQFKYIPEIRQNPKKRDFTSRSIKLGRRDTPEIIDVETLSSSEVFNHTSSVRDADTIRNKSDSRKTNLSKVKLQNEPVRKSPRIAQAKKLAQKTETPKKSIKERKKANKNVTLSKKPTSQVTHVTNASTVTKRIDQRVENLGLRPREHKQIVYAWPMRKEVSPYYTFERFDYK